MLKKFDLKPCPFCGAEVLMVTADFDRFGCQTLKLCCDCGVTVEVDGSPVYGSFSGGKFRPGPDAIEKWNARAGNE